MPRIADKRPEADHRVRVPGASGELARPLDAIRPVDGGTNAGRRERNRTAIGAGRRPSRPQRQGNYRLHTAGRREKRGANVMRRGGNRGGGQIVRAVEENDSVPCGVQKVEPGNIMHPSSQFASAQYTTLTARAVWKWVGLCGKFFEAQSQRESEQQSEYEI